MKQLLLTIILICSYNLCFADGYIVETEIDKFIIREGETVTAELKIMPFSKNWIIDTTGRSKIYNDDCIKSSASVWIHAKVEGSGLKEIGPFHVKIGNEIIKSNPMKVFILPKLNERQDFVVMGKRDPNGKNLFQIKIEYKLRTKNGDIGPIDLDHDSLPKGVELKSGSSGYSAKNGECDYTLKILTNDPVKITKDHFFNIPDWLEFPEIVIPEKENP